MLKPGQKGIKTVKKFDNSAEIGNLHPV